jgi:hypothetical protein
MASGRVWRTVAHVLRLGGCDRGDHRFLTRPYLRGRRRLPCIVLLKKPGREAPDPDAFARVVEFPREALNADIAAYVEENAHTVPRKRFGKNAWSLETSAVDELMEKIQQNGIPLAEFAGVKPLYGIKTGLNEAFLIDTVTKERLVREDPHSAEVIKPYLRGQNIKRWSPEWHGLWIMSSSPAATMPGRGATLVTQRKSLVRPTPPSMAT